MGFWQDLFGGKEGGIEKTSTLDPLQEELFGKIAPWLKGRIGEGLPAWKGPWTAPWSAPEEFGLGKYKEAITPMQPAEIHDWYQQYIAPSEKRYLKETLIPTFKESMVPGGTLRSTGTERGIGDIVTRFGEGQLGRIGEAIMNERERATGALPGYMRAAAVPREIAQRDLVGQIQEFIRTTPELSPILGMVMELLGINTQAAFYRKRQPSMFEQLLPVVGDVAGAYYGSQEE